MHGFGTGDFHLLEQRTLTQICLGQFETLLHFTPAASISMEGQYVHRTAHDVREYVQDRSSCGPNQLHRLPGATITEAEVSSPDLLKLTFSNGDILTRTIVIRTSHW